MTDFILEVSILNTDQMSKPPLLEKHKNTGKCNFQENA